MQRSLISFICLPILLTLSIASYSAPGDVLSSFTINNEMADGRLPTTPQGITYYNGHLYIMDFATDRIYRTFPAELLDEDEITVLFSPGDSDLNIPVADADNPPINSDGNAIGTCASAIPAGQYCGGGGLTYARNFLWNASPITDNIIKIDPVDGDNLESENTLATLAFPSPTDMAYDGTFFWIVDWQSNTINKVLPEDGSVIATIPGPSTKPTYQSNPGVGDFNARPFGIAWDGQALWVSDQSELMIYRVNPVDGSILRSFPSPGPDPKGLTWDGEFLWHADQSTQTIYKIDSGVIPFGIIGCLEKNGKAVVGDVLLSQTATPDQSMSTNTDGCFVFPSFTSGVPIQVRISETGVDEKPIITLNPTAAGSTDVTLIVGQTYAEPGFTAMDTEDGDISSAVVAVPDVLNNPNLISTAAPGPAGGYTVTYNVVDSAGNLADPQTRTVYVLAADVAAPVITLLGDNPLNVEQGSTYTEPGATASDDRDGDVSANITVTGSVNTNAAGTYNLSYNVSDSTGNAATTVVRTVNVADTGAPVITLTGNSSITIERGSSYTDQGATAFDSIDGDITSSIVKTGSVITNTPANYIITYNVDDSSGNAAPTVTRSVTVVDTTIPVITLIGPSVLNHELNAPFTDPGATALDTPNQNLTSSIVVTGSVNSSVAGTYLLTYNVTDDDGNAATSVTRQVIVSDTGSPSITILGDNPLNHEQGTPFSDPGATATDAIDGNLTSSIVVSGETVNVNVPGSYSINYDVTDSVGNSAPQQTRIVNVGDATPPVLTLLGNANVLHELGTPYTEAGATASDNVDGDITSSIVIGGNTVNINSAGTYTVTFNVSDSSGNAAAPVTRVVQVADRTRPVISLLGSATINHEVGTVYADPGATASDNIDGNITSNITVSGTVNAGVSGTYTLTYRVSDSAGNTATAVTRTVNVADTGAPSITLLGSATVMHELQTPYTDAGATASDAADGNLTSSIVTTGSVDANTAGTYTINYNVSDSNGNPATTVTRTIFVEDRTAPVITLIGDTTIDHTIGSLFTDPGYSAADNIDGDLTASINVGGTIDVNKLGSYNLTYNVTDSAGNAAATVYRTVKVVSPITVNVEAETASIGGAHTVETTVAGFTGSGYIVHSGEGYLEYTFGAFGVPYDLTVRYALDTGDRPLEVILNGVPLGNVSFPATGSFETWSTTGAITVTPESGTNTIRLQTTGSSGANIDQLIFTPQ